MSFQEDHQERQKARIEKIVAAAQNPEAAKKALSLLFPEVEKALSQVSVDGQATRERKQRKRISDRDSALGYFALSAPLASWSKPELAELHSDPAGAFARAEARIAVAPERYRNQIAATIYRIS